MSIGEEAEKRREKINSLRSKRSALLKQRDLSMKNRRMSAQDQVQQQKPMKKTFRVTIYER